MPARVLLRFVANDSWLTLRLYSISLLIISVANIATPKIGFLIATAANTANLNAYTQQILNQIQLDNNADIRNNDAALRAAEAHELSKTEKALSKIKEERKEKETKEKEFIGTLDKTIKELGSSGADLLERGVVVPVTEALRSTKQDLSAMFHAMNMAKAEKNESEKLSPVEKKVRQLESRLILEQLIYTDPVLSKLDDDALNSLMESYSTIVRKNPDIAVDKGLLRPILRQIVASGGVDVNSAMNLSTLSLNDAKVKALDKSRK